MAGADHADRLDHSHFPPRQRRTTTGTGTPATILDRRPVLARPDIWHHNGAVSGDRRPVADAIRAPAAAGRDGQSEDSGVGGDFAGLDWNNDHLRVGGFSGTIVSAYTCLIVITITVNGEPRELSEETTLRVLVQQFKLTPEKVAIELNKRLVKSDKYDSALKNGDEIEIVTFVGGG